MLFFLKKIQNFLNLGFGKVGGMHGMVEKYSYAFTSNTLFSNTSCGVPPSDYFDLRRAPDRDFPWPGKHNDKYQ